MQQMPGRDVYLDGLLENPIFAARPPPHSATPRHPNRLCSCCHFRDRCGDIDRFAALVARQIALDLTQPVDREQRAHNGC